MEWACEGGMHMQERLWYAYSNITVFGGGEDRRLLQSDPSPVSLTLTATASPLSCTDSRE